MGRRNFHLTHGKWDSVEILMKIVLSNLMKIYWKLTEKSAKNMPSLLLTFNMTLGILLLFFTLGTVEKRDLAYAKLARF